MKIRIGKTLHQHLKRFTKALTFLPINKYTISSSIGKTSPAISLLYLPLNKSSVVPAFKLPLLLTFYTNPPIPASPHSGASPTIPTMSHLPISVHYTNNLPIGYDSERIATLYRYFTLSLMYLEHSHCHSVTRVLSSEYQGRSTCT